MSLIEKKKPQSNEIHVQIFSAPKMHWVASRPYVMVKFKISVSRYWHKRSHATADFQVLTVDSKFSFKLVQLHNCPSTPKMSFAGRRRGNKVKKGVQFTVMVVGMLIYALLIPFASRHWPQCWPLGASGTGRTTFVNTLCESEVLAHKVSDNPECAHIEEGIRIKPVNVGK